MRQKLLFTTFVLIALLPASVFLRTDSAFGGGEGTQGRGIIYPGKGVDDIRIGEKLSRREVAKLKRKRLVIRRNARGRVKRIELSSPAFSVAVNLLRVKYNGKADVLRFYGKGATDLKSDRNKIIIKYPKQGIDFEIDKVSDRIEAITVYSPIRPKFKIEKYKEYRKQFKQKK